jgi:hypothetical protein
LEGWSCPWSGTGAAFVFVATVLSAFDGVSEANGRSSICAFFVIALITLTDVIGNTQSIVADISNVEIIVESSECGHRTFRRQSGESLMMAVSQSWLI